MYVDADGQPLPQQPNQEQVVYVDAPQEPPSGIQLEGSEPQLEERFAGQPPAPAHHQHQEVVRQVQEERMVRMRQVVKQITSPDGTVKEEIVSEEVVEVNEAERRGEERKHGSEGIGGLAMVVTVMNGVRSMRNLLVFQLCCSQRWRLSIARKIVSCSFLF